VKIHDRFYSFRALFIYAGLGVYALMLWRLVSLEYRCEGGTEFTPEGRTAAREVASVLRLTAFDYLNRCGQNNSEWAEGYRKGRDAVLNGFDESAGEKQCMARLSPAQLKAHLDSRLLQYQARARASMRDEKFEPGPCTVLLGSKDNNCKEDFPTYRMLMQAFGGLDDPGFHNVFSSVNGGGCPISYKLTGISEYAAAAFCSYLFNGFGYDKCEVVECGGKP